MRRRRREEEDGNEGFGMELSLSEKYEDGQKLKAIDIVRVYLTVDVFFSVC